MHVLEFVTSYVPQNFTPREFSCYQLILYQDINTVLKLCLNVVEVLSF